MGDPAQTDDWYFEHILFDASPGPPARLALGPAAQWRRWWEQRATESELFRAAAGHGFVLGVGDQRRLGVSRSTARTAVRRGRWLAAGHGVVAPLSVDGGSRFVVERRRHALSAAAAVLAQPARVVCGRSAAILHGLPTMSVPLLPEVARCGNARLGRRAGVHVHGADLPPDVVARWFGVPLTYIPRTVVDLARHDRRDGLMAADAALHQRLVSRADIERELERASGWPGIVQARAVLDLATDKAESPLESLTRLALHDSGFPRPEPQYEIGGFRVDLCWPDRRLVLEADGREKYQGDALWDEKKRETELRKYRYRVERVIWSDVVNDWPQTRDRIWAAWSA
jgi:very-short-patch-repair endonuclease